MPAAPRRVPTRSCVACRTPRAKRELVRVVRTPGGEVRLDPTGRLAGRGAYLCADGGCWSTALRRGALQRALETPLSPELRSLLEAGPTADGATATTETMTQTMTETTETTETTRGDNRGEK